MNRLCVNGRLWTVLTADPNSVVVHSIGLRMTRSVDRDELEERIAAGDVTVL
jgi:hypothetical protein